MAIPGTNRVAREAFSRSVTTESHPRVLDIGAGQGALTKMLDEMGFTLSACDVVPENFRYEPVTCKAVDPKTGDLPYEDASFDAAVAVEVVEHIPDHAHFFAEISRVLRPGGVFFFTTPNVLSLKSRVRFLFTGYGYSFGPLDPDKVEPESQHVSPFTLDRYQWMLRRAGFVIDRADTDKTQRSSMLYAPLVPLIRFLANRKYGKNPGFRRGLELQNSWTALTGRKIVVTCIKSEGAGS